MLASIEQSLMLVKRKPGVTDVRWNAASELIISLVPLGELSPSTVDRVGAVAESVCADSARMMIQVKGFGGIPNLIQPRYLIANLQGDVEALVSLASRLDQAVGTLIPPRDFRAFQPHITLGRLKTESESNRVALGRSIKLLDPPDMGSIQVEAIDLLISTASTSGIGYQVVRRLPLAS